LVIAAIIGALYGATEASLPADMRNWLPVVVGVIALAAMFFWLRLRQSRR
jgi:hypothetical protein